MDFNIDINTSYLFILIICNIFIFRKISDFLYNVLMNNNVIQRNIMLVGSIESIEKILKEQKDKINIYKCCLIKPDNIDSLEKARMLLKIPVFTDETEMRIILEYHELGQIWILDNEEKNLVSYYLDLVIKFSVDILVVNIKTKPNLLSENLLFGKFEFKRYEISKFYGPHLLIKIIIDKILSFIFLILACPILIFSSILIFLEDGFPVLFTQNRTGWDGRRFKIFKLRTLNKKKFDKTTQVTIDDNRKLRCGSFIRRFSIDEIPQLFNVLIGDMSIVGPRPHMVEHDIKYSSLFMNYLKRHKCNPGLTGWAQVNGLRGSTSDDQMQKRMEHDLWYLNNWNIFLDLYIILKTFYVIFKYKGE